MHRTCIRTLLGCFLLALAPAFPEELPELNEQNVDALAFRWLRDYVAYILTDAERDAFLSLETPQQRLAFIDRFWKRRDPTPGTPQNEFRDEHMRRYSYANKHFGSGKPGWKTDRGRTYIMLGPPQSRNRNAMGRNAGERASETWTYNGVKSRTLPASFDLHFLDFNDTGDYQLVSNLELAAPIQTYAGYIGHPLDLISRAVNADALAGRDDVRYQRDTFKLDELIQANFDLQRDLQAIQEAAQPEELAKSDIETRLQFHNLPVQISTAYYRSGGGLTRAQVSFSVDFSPFGSKLYQAQHYFHVELLSRLLRGGPSGAVIDEVREDLAFQVPEGQLPAARSRPLVYQFNHFAEPGGYTLELILRDAVSSRVSVTRQEVALPELGGDGLRLSTPLLCESIRKVQGPARSGVFRQGELELLPRVSGVFHPEEALHVYLQVYGASRDEKARHELEIGYRIWSAGGGLALRTPTQTSTGTVPGTIALYSELPLRQLSAGRYELEALARDARTGARASLRVPFAVQ